MCAVLLCEILWGNDIFGNVFCKQVKSSTVLREKSVTCVKVISVVHVTNINVYVNMNHPLESNICTRRTFLTIRVLLSHYNKVGK